MVDGRSIVFVQAVIATGSDPAVPGLTDGPFLTSGTAWGLNSLRERLVVLGGGGIGCEPAGGRRTV